MKTNQSSGGQTALRVAKHHRKPLVARCGFMWSLNHTRRYGPRDRRTRHALRVEQKLFQGRGRGRGRGATLVQVTTDTMRDDITQRLGDGVANRVRVVPNFVDTDAFRPHPEIQPAFDVVFVGRFGREKNVAALLEAVRDLPIRLLMIGGGGAMPAELQPIVEGGAAVVEWRGQVPHHQLAAALCEAKLFVLPSLYEGHPKALLEAMACGLPVLVTDRPGLREVVRHGVTGHICDVTPEALRQAIQTLLADEALRRRLGEAARAEVLERYSLDRIIEQETAVLEEAIALGKTKR
jgi:glycosyltransferase involved in cell wall biosynthesis